MNNTRHCEIYRTEDDVHRSATKFTERQFVKANWWKLPRRYTMALLCCIGFFITGWMRYSFVAMIVHILISNHESTEHFPNATHWEWDEIEMIDSCHYWGSLIGLIPSSLLATIYSPHKLFAVSITLTSLFQMLFPIAIRHKISAAAIINFCQGLALSPLTSACIGVWREWAPPLEKARLLIFAFSGQFMCMSGAQKISFYFAESLGVTPGYFIPAMIGMLFCLFWSTCTYESPSIDPGISDRERNYLESTIPEDNKCSVKVTAIPVKSIMTSLPLLALWVMAFNSAFILSLFSLLDPFLTSGLYKDEYEMNGWRLSIRYITLLLIIPIIGFFIDLLESKTKLSPTLVRKGLFCGSLIISSAFLFVTYASSGFEAFDFFYTAFTFSGLAIPAYILNVMDLSSRYACVLMGIARSFFALGEISFVYAIREIQMDTLQDWRSLHLIAALLAVGTSLLFGIFGSGMEQPWSRQLVVPRRISSNDAQSYPCSEQIEDPILVTESL